MCHSRKLWLAGVAEEEIHRTAGENKAQEEIEACRIQATRPAAPLGHRTWRCPALSSNRKKCLIGLIVIGKHAESVMGELLLGSVARHVVNSV
jgi:nucleotide-binding universal stress UspA family protein